MVSPREQAVSRDETVALTGLIGLLAITAAWWALALWPVPDAPGWLERTRYVCFGVTDSGLPDAGGWIGLIGGPLGMLAILLAGWWRGVRRLMSRARKSAALAATLGVLATGVVLLAAGGMLRVRQARAAYIGVGATLVEPAATYPRLDTPAPPLALPAHDGVTRTLADQHGRVVLVTFAFAHCQTVCPMIVKDVLEAQVLLGSESIATAVLIVTLDPWRDTPSRLPHIAARWRLPDRNAWLLGGDVADVEATLDAWEIPRKRDLRTGEVTHPALAYIVDRDGRIAFAASGGALTIAALVRRL